MSCIKMNLFIKRIPVVTCLIIEFIFFFIVMGKARLIFDTILDDDQNVPIGLIQHFFCGRLTIQNNFVSIAGHRKMTNNKLLLMVGMLVASIDTCMSVR